VRGRAATAAGALALLSVAGPAAVLLALLGPRARITRCLKAAPASCRKALGGASGSDRAPARSPVSITGGPVEALWPGGPATALRLSASNSTGEPLALVAVAVSARGTGACPAAGNLEIHQPVIPAPVTVPPHGTVALAGGSVRMVDLATDQDDCRGVTFRLSYAGTVR
jgi:hypothetical protein